MAFDRCADDVREFIERAAPSHPSVIDTEHLVAELYHVVNVPTMIWIDEQGRICRPHDSQFGTDIFTDFHGKLSEPYLDMLRAWVRTGEGALPRDEVDSLRIEPDAASQLARSERALAWWLHGQQRGEAAERHFVRADELAPNDWTIRRGSMPIRGKDPFGPEFFALAEEGKPDYPMEALTPTRKD
ncbi:MAG: thioredoxin family protein [Proteobacteria bacterium]|nr:thioredoxin family protein [Pseudomonadota bacterium]